MTTEVSAKSTIVHRCDFIQYLSQSFPNDTLTPSVSINRSLVIINSNTPSLNNVIKCLWSHCEHKLCADGGANRLYACLSETERSNFIPDHVVGDLDSLEDNVSEYYR